MGMEHVEVEQEDGAEARASKRASRREARAQARKRSEERLRALSDALRAAERGDFSVRLSEEGADDSRFGELARAFNGLVEKQGALVSELERVALVAGRQGKLDEEASMDSASGGFADALSATNELVLRLGGPILHALRAIQLFARGDLTREMPEIVAGRPLAGGSLELSRAFNHAIRNIRSLLESISEVVHRIDGEGGLVARADPKEWAGSFRRLVLDINQLASSVEKRVSSVDDCMKAIVRGDLSHQITLTGSGDLAALARTTNDMIQHLGITVDQVTTVAREVGIEGKLGGQALVPDASGAWKTLIDNVNILAANLTIQVREISEVARAVIKGDLTRTITVEASGEVLALKDTINQMIAQLAATTLSNEEQNWLKTSLTQLFGLVQGQRSLQSLASSVLSKLAPILGAQHGAFYLTEREDGETVLRLLSTYAYVRRKGLSQRFALGEGLVGQCALEKKPIIVSDIPDDYIHIGSGLGNAPPRSITVVPVTFEGEIRGVIELASFRDLSPIKLSLLEQLSLSLGQAINLIGTSMRTEELLQQLRGSNLELERRRGELELQAAQLEEKNRQVANASASLRGQAEELSRVSRYKSQFLANMSHEIRTPLNSMMILAQMLVANEERNLSERQREWAMTIQESGRDLLALINQILDLSKVEAGRIETHAEVYKVDDLAKFIEKRFRPEALQRNLSLSIRVDDDAPRQITTDRRLLEQITKNLLANAFKFTEEGGVEVEIRRAPREMIPRELDNAKEVLEVSVIDTGIGIPKESQEIIFDAFQQADASITRKYGGTGLGLTISREYARLLGGEVKAESEAEEGSTFRLFLPLVSADLAIPAADPSPSEPAPPIEFENEPPPLLGPRALAGKEVLVVEDDPRNLFAMTSLLESQGAIVIAATGAEEAYQRLKSHPRIALVLMDLMMPKVDGFTATRTIRQKPGYEELPIIAFTAKASEQDRNDALAAGCSDYISKPADTQRLLAIIARHLDDSQGAKP